MLGSSDRLGPCFSVVHSVEGWIVVLVFDGFCEFFFVVLEFHLKGDFNVFCFGHFDLRDSLEFFEVEKESPFFVFGGLFAKLLELFFIVEK